MKTLPPTSMMSDGRKGRWGYSISPSKGGYRQSSLQTLANLIHLFLAQFCISASSAIYSWRHDFKVIWVDAWWALTQMVQLHPSGDNIALYSLEYKKMGERGLSRLPITHHSISRNLVFCPVPNPTTRHGINRITLRFSLMVTFQVKPVRAAIDLHAIALASLVNHSRFPTASAHAKPAWIRVKRAVVRLAVVVMALRKAVVEPKFHGLHAKHRDPLKIDPYGSATAAVTEPIGVWVCRPFLMWQHHSEATSNA